MNKLSNCLSVLFIMLLTSAMSMGQKHEKQLSKAISKMSENIYYLTGNNGFGGVPKVWKYQEEIKKIATDEDLDSLARHCDIPAVKAMAFHTLVKKQSDRCYDIIVSSLADSSIFRMFTFDVGWSYNVASFFLDLACNDEDGTIFSDRQMFHLDSLVLYTPGLRHINMTAPALRLSMLNDLNVRMKELYYEGHQEILPVMLKSKNTEYIDMVISALREYHAGLDEQGRRRGREGATDMALTGIKGWTNEAFIPVLEEIRDHELSMQYINYYRVKILFKVVMAYDNDWAYNFIEDVFLNRGGNEKFSWPENLFRAYYEEKDNPRFKPLVDKYGKKPFDWSQTIDQ